MDKSHIKHTVSLIQYKILDSVQMYMSLTHQVKQTSWSSDQNINTFTQQINLRALIYTTKDYSMANTSMF